MIFNPSMHKQCNMMSSTDGSPEDAGWDRLVDEAFSNTERTGPGSVWLERVMEVLKTRDFPVIRDIVRCCGATGRASLTTEARADLEEARPAIRAIMEARQGEYPQVSDAQVDRVTLLACRVFAMCCAEGPGDGQGYGVGFVSTV